MKTGYLSFATSLCFLLSPAVRADDPLKFEPEEIDAQVQIGYGVAIGDVDGDKAPDILLADKRQFVWYRNPDWRRFVMAENLTERDNVCLAARDIDGDGRVEVAVGGQWNPGDTVNSGAVFYLLPPKDRRRKWTPVKLHHEPVVHRMRWVRLGPQRFVLVVAPLHGRGNRNGAGAGVRLLAYEPPAKLLSRGQEPEGSAPGSRAPGGESPPWKLTLLEDSLHVTHNLDPAQWNPTTEAEEILYLGREGAMLIEHRANKWSARRFERIQGGGEIRMGRGPRATRRPFIATIEPFHGDKLVVYESPFTGSAEGSRNATKAPSRVVVDDAFAQGHAIATGDLLGDDGQEIVAGWRNRNADGDIGVKLYYREADAWSSMWVDRNGMATEDIRLGDLNGDGRIDIVAAGRSTHNVKIYWNRGRP